MGSISLASILVRIFETEQRYSPVVVWIFLLSLLNMYMIIDVFHSCGVTLVYNTFFKKVVISRWFMGPPYFSISFVMLSDPAAFLFFRLLIAFSTFSCVSRMG